jgi:hypothetical protein
VDLGQGLTDLLAVALVAALAPLVVAVLPGPRIPQVVILLIGGVLIGPNGLGLAETSNIQLLSNIGLGFLVPAGWLRAGSAATAATGGEAGDRGLGDLGGDRRGG